MKKRTEYLPKWSLVKKLNHRKKILNGFKNCFTIFFTTCILLFLNIG